MAEVMAWGIEQPTIRLGVRLQRKVGHPSHSTTEDDTFIVIDHYLDHYLLRNKCIIRNLLQTSALIWQEYDSSLPRQEAPPGGTRHGSKKQSTIGPVPHLSTLMICAARAKLKIHPILAIGVIGNLV